MPFQLVRTLEIIQGTRNPVEVAAEVVSRFLAFPNFGSNLPDS